MIASKRYLTESTLVNLLADIAKNLKTREEQKLVVISGFPFADLKSLIAEEKDEAADNATVKRISKDKITSYRNETCCGKIFKCDSEWFAVIYKSGVPVFIIRLDRHHGEIYVELGCYTDLGESKHK